MVRFNLSSKSLKLASPFLILAAWCLLALNASGQPYPEISGTYQLSEVYSISAVIGGSPSVQTYTNYMTVDVLQTDANFWIVPSGTTDTTGYREGTLSGNSVTAMSGPAMTLPTGWSVSSNSITGVSGTIFTNYMYISLDGAASGVVLPGYNPFTAFSHSDIYLTGTFFPLLPPTITSQPVGATNLVGDTVTFSVAVTGATNFTYQWRKNDNLIPGATDATYTINGLKTTDAGNYMVHVENAIGSTNSASVVLAVNTPASVKTQPASGKVYYGVTAKLSVAASGTPPYTYQWRLNGTNIPGATSSTYSFTAVPINGVSTFLYSVGVSNIYGGVISSDAVVTVVRDPSVPSVSITTPASGSRSTNFHLAGTATDNGVVAGVSYRVTNVNNGVITSSGVFSATLQGTNPISRIWSADPVLLPGTNIVAVYATDLQGSNSAIKTRQFFYRVPTSLVITSIGQGAIVGKSTASGPGEPVPALGTSQLYIGQGYSVQANPAMNWLFSGWTMSLAGADRTVTNATLPFIMEPGLVLTANFVTNPFVGFANTYYGAFNADPIAPESSGLLRQFIVSKTGAFSGQLVLNGAANTITGAFGIDGHVAKTYVIKNVGPVVFDMTIAAQDGANSVTGTVTGPSWTSQLNAQPALASLPSGQRTFVIPPDPAQPSLTGYGVILATNTGPNAILTVTLADGTTTTLTSTVLNDGTMPFYGSLYKSAGVLAGWVSMTNSTVDSPVVWIKKTSPAPNPNGFTNSTTLMVSTWTAPAAKTAALPFTSASPAALQINAPTLSEPLSFLVAVSPNNTITKLPGSTSPNSLTGTVDPKTGAFKLTCGTTGHATAAATGAVLQSALQGFGICGSGTNYGAVTLMGQ